jgi:hypothetical protein
VIIVHVRHGRTDLDATRLAKHVLRSDDNEAINVAAVVGLAANNVADALAAMRRLAPHRSAAAFHHVSLAPASDCTVDDLREDADRVLREMGVDPAVHPHALIVHEKPSPAGRGRRHAHLVASHWGLEGERINDSWLHLRFERLAREIEFDRGEPLTCSRHDRSLAKALRQRGRSDVAQALEAGSPAETPRSAITSEKRQRLRRAGVSDVALRATVKAIWAASAGSSAFLTALADKGLKIAPGTKPGVYLVVTPEGVEIGALDRVVRQPRWQVRQFLDKKDGPDEPSLDAQPGNPVADANNRRADYAAPSLAPALENSDRRPEPAGATARDVDRNSDNGAREQRAPEALGKDAGGAREAQQQRRSEKLKETAAAQVLADGLDVSSLKGEASRRSMNRRMAELREIADAAKSCIASASRPPQQPAAVTEAVARRNRTTAETSAAKSKAAAAKQAADQLERRQPRGWRRLLAWVTGASARHRAELAKAYATLKRRQEEQFRREVSARAAVAVLEQEESRAKAGAKEQLEQRRHLIEQSRHTLVRVHFAVLLVTHDEKRANLPLHELFQLAEEEWRRQYSIQEHREHEPPRKESGFAPSPRMW